MEGWSLLQRLSDYKCVEAPETLTSVLQLALEPSKPSLETSSVMLSVSVYGQCR